MLLVCYDLVIFTFFLTRVFLADEAHKGTGDYAYAQVIRYMMAKNPYFRVLALTATPGSNPEAVQEIVDALHISRIEIRDEQSLDLVSYMHKKNIQQHYIDMTEEYQGIVDLLSPMMEVRFLLGLSRIISNCLSFLPLALNQKFVSWKYPPWSPDTHHTTSV